MAQVANEEGRGSFPVTRFRDPSETMSPMKRWPTVSDIAARIRKDRQVLGAFAYLIDALVLGLFVFVLALAIPNFVKAREKAKEDEVKANLKTIQVALERYATDHDGLYPLILYGGHPSDTFATSRAAEVSEFPGDVDWLMEAGYLEAYPQNPFRRGNKGPVRLQAKDFFPEEFRYAGLYSGRKMPRVNIWSRGGLRGHVDRSRQWAARLVGGFRGDCMWEVSEGQRHPPFLLFYPGPPLKPDLSGTELALIDANPSAEILTESSSLPQQVWPAVGNFYYYPLFTGIGNLGSFENDGSGPDYEMPIMGRVTGYKLAGYGGTLSVGQDSYNWYGDFGERSLGGDHEFFNPTIEMSLACVFSGPDGRWDGVIAVVQDPVEAGPSTGINQDD